MKIGKLKLMKAVRLTQNQFSKDKIFYHTDRLRKFLNNELVYPIVFEISPAGFCNQNCIYCCSKQFQSRTMLSKVQLTFVIDQIAEIAMAITFTGGGEPLLNTWLPYEIIYAKKKGLSIGILTNGSNFSEENINAIIDNAKFCRISLDSIDPEVFKDIRKPKKYDLPEIISGIKKMVERKRHTRSSILIGLHIVWYNQTRMDIENTVKFFSNLGIDFLQIRPVDNVPNEPFKPNYPFYQKQKSFLENIKETYSNTTFNVVPNINKFNEYYSNKVYKEYPGCPGGNFTASIGNDFNVYFCCTHLGNKNFLLGNLSKDTLKDILNSSIRKEMIKNCNHNECQFQCRNHVVNKLLYKLIKMENDERERILSNIDLNNKPMHYEFL
ncbi:MAG: radical SAM/SPASM domain-containing protein [Candidatus Cloacimonetes bacterium]|nr:radical SAM/SPASM domain-containing protein [Candidatus Cloacimonadota bacterium]MBL7087091.1 radical SAM/SPASM domain-containing protein [Candidatus Cloacimonadota bacterium]